MSPEKSARDAALARLSYRMRTEKEISDYLVQSGYTGDERKDALDFLREYGYTDDVRYSKEYYLYSRSKGKAAGRIIRELEQKGIPAGVSRRAIAEMENEAEYEGRFEDEAAAAMKIAVKMARDQKERGGELDRKFLARVGRRLASLGYDTGLCYSIMTRVKDYGKDDE